MRRSLLLAFGALALSACDGGDGGDPDAGQPVELPALTANTENADVDPPVFEAAAIDYACLGTSTRPEGGEAVDATFHLIDFQEDFDVAEAEVWFFTDNVIADTCVAPSCQMLTTDATGNATVTAPAGGWYAYRVLPHDDPFSDMRDIFGVFQYNEPAPTQAGGTVTGNSVSGVTIDLIPALLGITRTEGLAIVAGRVEDCSGQFVQNAIIRLYDPDGNEIVAPADPTNDEPHFNYFNGNPANNLPDLTEPHTNADGLYVLVQIPYVSEQPYRVEAWGNRDGELTLLSCETARIFEDAVTILNMTPLRADAPAGCAAP